MREIVIGENEAGQRLDKFLAKYMKKAPKSFFYKMLRKKNIVLNGKKRQETRNWPLVIRYAFSWPRRRSGDFLKQKTHGKKAFSKERNIREKPDHL